MLSKSSSENDELASYMLAETVRNQFLATLGIEYHKTHEKNVQDGSLQFRERNTNEMMVESIQILLAHEKEYYSFFLWAA